MKTIFQKYDLLAGTVRLARNAIILVCTALIAYTLASLLLALVSEPVQAAEYVHSAAPAELTESRILLTEEIPTYRRTPPYGGHAIVEAGVRGKGPYTACASIQYTISDAPSTLMYYQLWQADEHGEWPLLTLHGYRVDGAGPHIIDTCGVGVATTVYTEVELRVWAKYKHGAPRPHIHVNPRQTTFMRILSR